MTTRFAIPIPTFSTATSGPNNVLQSLVTPIPQYSDVHLGQIRKLTNIAVNIFLQCNYTIATPPGLSRGVANNALATFALYVNGIQQFLSSSQVTLEPVSQAANVFVNAVNFGLYTDLINPIILRNGDQLAAFLQMSGYDIQLFPEDSNSATNPWLVSFAQATLGNPLSLNAPSGYIYCNEEPE